MTRLVDWELAETVARSIAADGPAEPTGMPPLAEAEGAARELVFDYTGLDPTEALPDPEWVSRREWAAINLAGLRQSIAPLEDRFEQTVALPAAARGAVEAVVSRATAIEVGALIGYASKRVLGQYEFALLGGERPPRLLFVGPNIDEARTSLGADPATMLRWIALHETTHAVHLSAAPWMREHIGAIARELIAEANPGIGATELVALARRAISEDPRKLLAQLRSSDPMSLLASAPSRARIERLQATMAAIEGFAEHVMDAAAPELGAEVAELREGIERRRRSRGVPARILAWLLGMEMKMRQYREGKRFVDEVVAEAGTETLNRAWQGPENLPSGAELADPELWLLRIGGPRAASAGAP